MGWIGFALALTAFMAAHVVPSRPALRGQLIAWLGPRGYTLGYSVVSLALLYALILAAGQAPRVTLWDPSQAARWLVNLAMPLALVLVSLAVGAPNPLSFGGRASGFDADRPGLAGLTRHPLLWALLIWSGAHLVANGDLAHVILFGVFAAFSIAGMVAIDARNRRRLGAAGFAALTRTTPLIPLARGWPVGWGAPSGLALRLAIAMLAWAVLYHLHQPLIGMSPQP